MVAVLVAAMNHHRLVTSRAHDLLNGCLIAGKCVAELSCPGAKHIILLIYLTINKTAVAQGDITDTIGGHGTAITGLGLETLKLVAIKTAKPVPSAEPDETVIVLQHL